MAHVQEQYSLDEVYTSPTRPRPQSQSSFFYDFENIAARCPELSMTRPLVNAPGSCRFPHTNGEQQSPFIPGRCMTQLQWSIPQASLSDNMMFAHPQLGGQHAVSSHNTIWSGVPNESAFDDSIFANNELLYSHDASQSTLNKVMDFSKPSFWPSERMPHTAPSPSADILLSPVSRFSDVKHTYSPGSDCSPATPKRSTTSYRMSHGAMKMSTPGFTPSTPQSAFHSYPGDDALQYASDVPQISANAFDDTAMYGPEYAYEHSQRSSLGTSPWYPPGYVEEKAALAQDSHQLDAPTLDLRPNPYLAPLEHSSRQRQEQWSNKNTVPEQRHFQTRFMAPMTDSEKAQRTKDDETLLEMKRDGYTYKDIRKRLGRKVAESTLRGRYRSLTKPRSARVRAPKWTEVDVALMRRYVQDEFDKLDQTQPSLDPKQKPDKIPWAKVSERMAATGGSYKFGAATVKKEWRETSRLASSCTSRRRSRA